MKTETMPSADPYTVGRSDERRLERAATLAQLRAAAVAVSGTPAIRDELLRQADIIERGEHRPER